MFEVKGKVIKILPLIEGKSQRGEWKKQEFILETKEKYPKTINFSMWGEKIEEVLIQENDEITVFFNLESREYKERWYTEARAWKIEKAGELPAPPETDAPPIEADDLPF